MAWLTYLIEAFMDFLYPAEPAPESLPEPQKPPPEPVPAPEPPKTPRRDKLLATAISCLGREMSPHDFAPDALGCVESLEGVYKEAFGRYISGLKAPLLGTAQLLDVLRSHPDFEEVSKGEPGDIVLSATGTGNGKIRGHVGILGAELIFSNNSGTSLWDSHFTPARWEERYAHTGSIRTRYFRVREV